MMEPPHLQLRVQMRVIVTAFQLQLKQIAVDGFVLFTAIIQPLVFALLGIYMLRDTEGFKAIYVVVGGALTGLWSGTLFFSSFNVRGERWMGTLEYIVGSPTALSTVIIGKSLANSVMSLSSLVLGYAIALALFQFDLTITNSPAFIVSLLLGVIALVSMGLVIAPFMALNIGADAWVNALEYPIYMLGGFLFPIALLPNWTTPLSYLLAPYWAARAIHGTSSGGAPLQDVVFSWMWLIVFSVLYLGIAQQLFKRLIHKARVDATLGMH